MTLYQPSIDQGMEFRAWWTDNDPSCDLCLTGGTDNGPSFNLSYQEAKYLFNVLKQKFTTKE